MPIVDLLNIIANIRGTKLNLISVPVRILKFIMRILGKKSLVNSSLLSLEIDSSKAERVLGWKPVIIMEDQLKKVG